MSDRTHESRSPLPPSAGKLFDLGGSAPLRHAETWIREPTSGPERLRIGAGQSPIRLLSRLARSLLEPLFVLAVLRVPRTGEPGKLESEALTYAETNSFLAEFRELFENDARAQVWVGSTTGHGLLVLDEHDFVYGYGPLDAFEDALRAWGFELGDPRVPDPHEHHYNEELDYLETRLRSYWDWRRVLPIDDDEDQ